jgi:GntR family transcriptional regulator/MocR family aminotransferase
MEIYLRRGSGEPLSRQIYADIKGRILEGTLQKDECLPSTREMAKDLLVSRNTVSEAYEMLLAEGYIISRQGAPSRVAGGLMLPETGARRTREPRTERPVLADFTTGRPELRAFPYGEWMACLKAAGRELPVELLGYTGPQGFSNLREEISAWVYRSRGIRADPGDIFITGGTTQAISLLFELLTGDRKKAVVEDPCHSFMWNVLAKKGCALTTVPVDEQGMQAALADIAGAALVYVTPSHQFPLGGILSAERRVALIRQAREHRAYIVEDDYDSEYRYAGAPVEPLYALDPDRVIYVGTFSKILFPALRIGYVVLPEELHKGFSRLKTYADTQNPPFEQAALAEFLRTRKMDAHVHRMRKLYGERRLALLRGLQDAFGDGWRAFGDAAGLHMAVQFEGMRFGEGFKRQAREAGIRIARVEDHAVCRGNHADKLLLGYGHLTPEEIHAGVEILHSFITNIR